MFWTKRGQLQNSLCISKKTNFFKWKNYFIFVRKELISSNKNIFTDIASSKIRYKRAAFRSSHIYLTSGKNMIKLHTKLITKHYYNFSCFTLFLDFRVSQLAPFYNSFQYVKTHFIWDVFEVLNMSPILFFKCFHDFTFKKEWNMVAALYTVLNLMRKRFYKRGKVTSSLNNKMNDDLLK